MMAGMTASLGDLSWPVRSRRLTIRPASAADLEDIWEIRRLESVARWMTSLSANLDEFRTRIGDPEQLGKTLVIEVDGVIIGDLMLAIEDAWSQAEVVDQARGVQAELGWCLSPDHKGNGYATEAVSELIRICFECLGLRRVIANCFADNEASWRLMERLHMRRETHTVRESLHRSGEWLDGLTYALLADEWRARRLDEQS